LSVAGPSLPGVDAASRSGSSDVAAGNRSGSSGRTGASRAGCSAVPCRLPSSRRRSTWASGRWLAGTCPRSLRNGGPRIAAGSHLPRRVVYFQPRAAAIGSRLLPSGRFLTFARDLHVPRLQLCFGRGDFLFGLLAHEALPAVVLQFLPGISEHAKELSLV